MSLNDTPRGTRLHIGIYGKRNSGKSSLLNALTGHQTAVTSDTPGTTTDPVYKSMEIHGIGPVVLIDTAGFDDSGELGAKRVEMTRQALDKTDIAVMVYADMPSESDNEWIKAINERRMPLVTVVNKADLLGAERVGEISEAVRRTSGKDAVRVSALTKEGIREVTAQLIRLLPPDYDAHTLVGRLVDDGDLVLLVMPQDIQAPKGRLILPQVQTLRELLDDKCIVMSCTTDRMSEALATLNKPPRLIITDSQAFKQVYALKPPESMLTSFSILMAGAKGDIDEFVAGAKAIGSLTETSRVLIAEACTHVPLNEDIGREQIPRMLRKLYGEKLQIDHVSGTDYPDDLSQYNLIIHCGACMFNRRYVLSRIERARKDNVPITNYGVALAYMGGILDKVTF